MLDWQAATKQVSVAHENNLCFFSFVRPAAACRLFGAASERLAKK